MGALYNEIEPYAAQWLENLAAAGHVAAGTVDRRSIVDLTAADVRDHRQVHFFAGIGGWSHALCLAGWPDDEPVWTGSCPCQPFSAAGRRKGFDDARHLWPVWFKLIRECQPPIVFGEQVANPDGLKWLDLVCRDLEDADYSVGACDLAAASVGAPHIRQRLYFVAISNSKRREGLGLHLRQRQSRPGVSEVGRGGEALRLAHDERDGLEDNVAAGSETRAARGPGDSSVADATIARWIARGRASQESDGRGPPWIEPGRLRDAGNWRECDWLPCLDGKTRPVEPGTFPLAHGVPARVGKLRAYGNAIVPPLAAAFIQAVTEAL